MDYCALWQKIARTPMLISCQILGLMYGLGLDFIFTHRIGACSLSTSKNRELKT